MVPKLCILSSHTHPPNQEKYPTHMAGYSYRADHNDEPDWHLAWNHMEFSHLGTLAWFRPVLPKQVVRMESKPIGANAQENPAAKDDPGMQLVRNFCVRQPGLGLVCSAYPRTLTFGVCQVIWKLELKWQKPVTLKTVLLCQTKMDKIWHLRLRGVGQDSLSFCACLLRDPHYSCW